MIPVSSSREATCISVYDHYERERERERGMEGGRDRDTER